MYLIGGLRTQISSHFKLSTREWTLLMIRKSLQLWLASTVNLPHSAIPTFVLWKLTTISGLKIPTTNWTQHKKVRYSARNQLKEIVIITKWKNLTKSFNSTAPIINLKMSRIAKRDSIQWWNITRTLPALQGKINRTLELSALAIVYRSPRHSLCNIKIRKIQRVKLKTLRVSSRGLRLMKRLRIPSLTCLTSLQIQWLKINRHVLNQKNHLITRWLSRYWQTIAEPIECKTFKRG